MRVWFAMPAVVAALVLVPSAVLPQVIASPSPPSQIRVAFRLQASDEALAAVTHSYISREFRKLGDVLLVEDGDPEYTFMIYIMELSTKGGIKTGYAVSSVGVQQIQKATASAYAKLMGIDESGAMLVSVCGGSGLVTHHSLQTGGMDSLEELCSRAVAAFDTDSLETKRQVQTRMREQGAAVPR